MDESIKCECGNDKFWWFGDYSRCTSCYNEYMFNDENLEYWMRRFNKEENHYPENWEHFNPQTSVKERFDKFREDARKLHPYIVPNEEIPSFHEHMEKMVSNGEISKEAFELLTSKDDSIVENAVEVNELEKKRFVIAFLYSSAQITDELLKAIRTHEGKDLSEEEIKNLIPLYGQRIRQISNPVERFVWRGKEILHVKDPDIMNGECLPTIEHVDIPYEGP